MSRENVEIIRRMYDALNREDRDAVFCNTHPDFEVTFVEGPRAGTHGDAKPCKRLPTI